MRAAHYNIDCDQATDFRLVLTVDGIDLTDATAEMQVRRSVETPTTLVELSTDNGRIVIDAEAEPPTITLSLDAEVTAELDRSGVYDLRISTPTLEGRLLRGEFRLALAVTRD